MSTLCRADWKCRNVWGARPSRSPGGASRAALPDKEVFGGTPTTARETPALPIHLSVFLKGRVEGLERISENRKYFGKTALFRKYFGLFFWPTRKTAPDSASASQTGINSVKNCGVGQNGGQIACKYFKMNGLQHNRRSVQSNPVKVNQTDLIRACTLAFSLQPLALPLTHDYWRSQGN